ncbi:MAG: DNA alkylation repair protein [Bacteroidota bacterium]
MNAQNVIAELEALANPEKAEHSKRFFKSGPGEYAEGDTFFGVTVPEQRKIAKRYRKLELPEVEQLVQYPIHEVRLTGLMLMVYAFEKGDDEYKEAIFNLYMSNLAYVNNWDLVDASCRFIIGQFLENKNRELLYDLAKSDDLWKNRIAMISCYHFIHYLHEFDDALNIAELLLHHSHDLIHKAVGWMLREVGKIDRSAEEAFLQTRYKTMPRTMLRYAIEHFEEPVRKAYLAGKI